MAYWCQAASRSGAEGKIQGTAQFARRRKIPYFGICFGMQMAVIEAARNLAGIPEANSTELAIVRPVVNLLTEWMRGNRVEQRDEYDEKGGTMRLGSYPCRVEPGSQIADIYGGEREINERHRHRFEVNVNYRQRLEDSGMRFSGMSPDKRLP